MVTTTVQHSAFPDAIEPYPYVVVTKSIWKGSISEANWCHNTPRFTIVYSSLLTPSWEFHSSWVWISIRGVVYSFPSPIPPIIGGTSVLNADIILDRSLVFCTLSACTSSLCDFAFYTVSPVTNFKSLTIHINHWNWPSGICFSEKSTHYIFDINHLPPANISIPSMWSATSFICPSNLFSHTTISIVPTFFPTPTVIVFSSRCFILSYKISRNE